MWIELHTGGQAHLFNMDRVDWVRPSADGQGTVLGMGAGDIWAPDGDIIVAAERYEHVKTLLTQSGTVTRAAPVFSNESR